MSLLKRGHRLVVPAALLLGLWLIAAVLEVARHLYASVLQMAHQVKPWALRGQTMRWRQLPVSSPGTSGSLRRR